MSEADGTFPTTVPRK
jgi:hypothetical protein